MRTAILKERSAISPRQARVFDNRATVHRHSTREPSVASSVLVFGTTERAEMSSKPRDGKVPDLCAPLRVDRLRQTEHAQIQRKIGHVQKVFVVAEGRTGRKKQSVGQAMIVNAFEIAELGDQFSTRADDYNFISLIGGNPEIVMAINRNTVSAVDAVDEY